MYTGTMAGEYDNDQIRGAALELLKDPHCESARSILCGALFSQIDRGAKRAVRLSVGDSDELELHADPFVVSFLGIEGLLAPKLLEKLSEADHPNAYVEESTFNFVRGELRKSPLLRPAGSIDEQGPDGESIYVDEDRDTVAADDRIDRSRRVAAQNAALARLSDDERLFLSVVLIHKCDLPDASVRRIARKRGVEPDVVRAELEARDAEQEAARVALQRRMDMRTSRVSSVQDQMAQMHVLCKEHGAVEPAKLDVERRRQLRNSVKAREQASHEEQLGYLLFLAGELEQCVRRQKEARSALVKHTPAGPRYEQALRILGDFPDDPAEQKKVLRNVTARFKDIRRKLRRLEAYELEMLRENRR